jgi:hypothetical protein
MMLWRREHEGYAWHLFVNKDAEQSTCDEINIVDTDLHGIGQFWENEGPCFQCSLNERIYHEYLA